MASAARAVGNAAKKAVPNVGKGQQSRDRLGSAPKRDPELYILGGIMGGAFALAGFYFSRKQTGPNSEQKIIMSEGSMPWQSGHEDEGNPSEHSKYKYHPGGDPRNPAKDAPSALNVTIIPNVTLPKSYHDRMNKWSKEGY